MMKETMQERKKRTEKPLWSERDKAALTWMAQQYAIRMDHLHVLLEQLSNRP
jgi:hypothetical protein